MEKVYLFVFERGLSQLIQTSNYVTRFGETKAPIKWYRMSRCFRKPILWKADFTSQHTICGKHLHAHGSLVGGASDSELENLSSIPETVKYPSCIVYIKGVWFRLKIGRGYNAEAPK